MQYKFNNINIIISIYFINSHNEDMLLNYTTLIIVSQKFLGQITSYQIVFKKNLWLELREIDVN